MKKFLIFLAVSGLLSCTNFDRNDKNLTLEEECKQAGSISKQCEIFDLKELTLDEKENLMGWVYLNGAEKVQPNFDKAYYWFEKSAKSNNNEALNSLGMIFYAGMGRERDFEKAEEYYLKANKLGNKDAKVNLAELYRSKDFSQLPDYEKAESWYLLGTQDNPSRAYDGLSKMYLDQENYEKAFEFSKKSAELGNPEAQYNLGVFFEKGIYVKKDKKQAEYWYEKSAKQGHLNAINNLNVIRQE
ncbi:tetratricopeptide repeat protein [Acinetobacter sp. V102_4]|uniref:tetratricopeptide repeat protein n=1 Tax=Acinetobacter sp. V102_4 TaxID=3072984 RepID=UPI00287E9CC4|nr:tetratricopeptide repeat protein [Acinetobacter sp. V102_4]MDS7928268.1 tetratricopeptide repeat protein [Acinetobacter sp. V102_4]